MFQTSMPQEGNMWKKFERFVARNTARKPMHVRSDLPLVSVTFDDMNLSSFTTGANILEQSGSQGTYYVNGALQKDAAGSTSETARLLTDLHAAGHEIACHSHSHPDFQDLSANQMMQEIKQNSAYVRSLGLPDPTNFAYPLGNINLTAKRVTSGCFESCRGVKSGINAGPVDLGHLRATRLFAHQYKKSRVTDLLDKVRRDGGWLIFFTHGVNNDPGEVDVRPNQLKEVLKEAAFRDLPVVTVAEALRRYRGK